MKPKFLLKGAVVAMAAFGAFAFNPSGSQQSFYVHESSMCENVDAECSSSGIIQCTLKVGSENLPLWLDTECLEPAYYSNQ